MPPVFGCVVRVVAPPPVPPVLDGFVVVVVDPAGLVVAVVELAGFVVAVVVVDALELDEVACAVEGVAADDDADVLDDDDDREVDDEPDAFGFVVLVVPDALVVVFFLPPRSPGCASASATPATSRTIAAINRGTVRDLMLGGERVTGVEPASPAWKAGALPLSYTRGSGRTVLGRTCSFFHHCPATPIRSGSWRVSLQSAIQRSQAKPSAGSEATRRPPDSTFERPVGE